MPNIENVEHQIDVNQNEEDVNSTASSLIEEKLNYIPENSSELSSAQTTNNVQNEQLKINSNVFLVKEKEVSTNIKLSTNLSAETKNDTNLQNEENKDTYTNTSYRASIISLLKDTATMKNMFTWLSQGITLTSSILQRTIPTYAWIGSIIAIASLPFQAGYFVANTKVRKNGIEDALNDIDPNNNIMLTTSLDLSKKQIEILRDILKISIEKNKIDELKSKSKKLFLAETIGESISMSLILSSNMINIFVDEDNEYMHNVALMLTALSLGIHLLCYQKVARSYKKMNSGISDESKEINKQIAYFIRQSIEYSCKNIEPIDTKALFGEVKRYVKKEHKDIINLINQLEQLELLDPKLEYYEKNKKIYIGRLLKEIEKDKILILMNINSTENVAKPNFIKLIDQIEKLKNREIETFVEKIKKDEIEGKVNIVQEV